MIVDVVDAVAAVALALGAVAEFQIGIIRVGAAADSAFVPVGTLAGAAAVVLRPVGIRLRVHLGLEITGGFTLPAGALPALRKAVSGQRAQSLLL